MGSTIVYNKGLTLNGGVLYVDGDLTIQGGVTGYGAVFSTGKMRVTGGSDLGTDSLCALVAGQDLTLKGDGANTTQFRGLVYSDGALTVSDVTVVGALVGNSPIGATMTVDRANLVYDPEGVNLTFNLQFSGFRPVDGTFGGGVKLSPVNGLTPNSLFEAGKFREPTNQELQEGLLFVLPGRPPRSWDDLSQSEKDLAGSQLLSNAARVMRGQIQDWNELHLNPHSLDATYHLDLNRFVKVQDSMKILTRRLSPN